MNLMIVPGILVGGSFLISVSMFIAHNECYSDCSRRGNHLVEPFYTVLFNGCTCSAFTVECCVVYPCCVGVFGMFAVM